jgi:hypothetical protein
MTKTEQLAEKCADKKAMHEAEYYESYIAIKDAYINGAQDMLESVLDFMRNFQNGNGEFPLYDYIGNVRKAMEK